MTEIRIADNSNFNIRSLDDFSRHQVVKNVMRFVDGELKPIYCPFTEDWDSERKAEKAQEVLSGDYITYCAFEDGRVLGMIMLVPALSKGRMIVHSFHVSDNCRRQGLGRRLFETACARAREAGARALYISACSSEETIGFYMAMGCVLSPDPIKEMVEDEPYDVQLEYNL